MTTLMVSPFAPYRDGIAAYAVQELRRLRSESSVEVLSPQPSAARLHLRLGSPVGWGRLARIAADYDRTIVQFGPEMMFGRCRSSAERVGVWMALAGLAKVTALDLRIHEVEYGPLDANPAERWAARLALGQADRVTVHTEAERAKLHELVPTGAEIEIVDHGRDFAAASTISKAEARAELGLSPDRFIFVAIGFLQQHKGFDRAVAALDELRMADVELHVVGSARVDAPEILGYVDDLTRRCAQVPGAHLHRRYVSDVEFDQWIQAADAVVLPYREIWSSGVLERARLLATPVIASDLSQLRDQAPEGTLFFDRDDELPGVMADLVIARRGPAAAISSGRTSTHALSDGDAIDLSSTADSVVLAGAPPMPPDDARGGAPSPWGVDIGDPDRPSVQAEVVARARRAELAASGSGSSRSTGHGSANAMGDGRALDPLLALGHLARPEPTSARPGVAPAKRLIDRLIAWRVDPLFERLDALQRATLEAASALDAARASAASTAASGAGDPVSEPLVPTGPTATDDSPPGGRNDGLQRGSVMS